MRRFLNLDRVLLALACGCGSILFPISVLTAQSLPERKETPSQKAPARKPDLEKRKEDLNKQSEAAFERRDYKGAEAVLRELIEIDGENFVPWYNLACSLSMQGRTEDAGPMLEKAIELGFSDLTTLQSDPHMAALRRTPNYRRLADSWGKILNERIENNLDALKKSYGPAYTFEKDPALRLVFASAFAPSSFLQAKKEVARMTVLWETLVSTPVTGSVLNPAATRPAREEPDDSPAGARDQATIPWVFVVLPTQDDYAKWAIAKFGPAWERVGGSYSHDEKKLVAKDLSSTLRHEYWHVLHWRDLTARRQMHPIWIMEGLCSLPEDLETLASGELKPVASWRTNQARHLARSGTLTPWDRLFKLDHKQFIGSRPLAYYAQARCIFLYLHSRGKLKEWYQTYVDGYGEDATGAKAFEKVLGKPLKDIQKDFAAWLRLLPQVQEEFKHGDAVFPFDFQEGTGDGIVVASIVSTRSREGGVKGDRNKVGAGLRIRDVITAVDGKPVREMAELIQVLGEYFPGTEVEVEYRRGKTTGTAKLVLVAFK
ncbi:MAG: PDZ domain-containing protein [Pyrinomonadaceae bacterium]|nr:PDZ domain-containing protein [Phycisphaerales bacterium]